MSDNYENTEKAKENKEDIILEMKSIVKEFPGVKALDNVNLKIRRGEIHCICGENGAGKSTLMKVLSGVYPGGSFQGEIFVDGEKKNFKSISDSEKDGIAIIYQELALVPHMTIYENLFLGQEISKGGVVDINETISRSKELLKKVKLNEDVSTKIKDLGVGKQQLIEIAKALKKDVKILIFDEPTAALNEDDSANLLELIKELKKNGVTCIMISHKLREVIYIADNVTILRDGKTICDIKKEEISENLIIKNMVGRQIDNIYPQRDTKCEEEKILEIKDLTGFSKKLDREVLKNISMHVKKGEVVGISGLIGAGRTEIAHSIFGNIDKLQLSGDIYFDGKKANFKNPSEAIKNGIAYVTEDRKKDGLILIDDVKNNVSLANLKSLTQNHVVNVHEEVNVAKKYVEYLKIKTPSIEQKVGNLSGGNQQKVSVSKWLYTEPKMLILDEPTRGIDVGAKFEIYTLINELVAKGLGILIISSDLLEIIGVSDRVYVLAEGEIKGEVQKEDLNEEAIMELATR